MSIGREKEARSRRALNRGPGAGIALAVWVVALGLTLVLGARGAGRLPPLGPLLDPGRGAWGLARAAEQPNEETVRLPGLAEPVRVVYDDRGVPHIFAGTSEDAARALGYVVARDRLFQLEFRWRTTAGRLSELLGDGALDFDRRMRRLGLARSAARDLAAMDSTSPHYREILAYAEGVNAWIEGLGSAHLPLEYRLLDRRPVRWEPVYSLYLLKLMGYDLTYSLSEDLELLRLRARVGREAARALVPVNSPIQQPIQPNGESGPRYDLPPLPPPGSPDEEAERWVDELELALGPLLGRSGGTRSELGSNNWAVSPQRASGGYALLAGDPHLSLTLPSIWYEVHLVVPGVLDVYGVTIPSVPLIVIGFNRRVAWSFTNTGADVIDYYREELDDAERPERYRVDGEWLPLERRIEVYHGRGGERLAVDTLYHTHRGPVIWHGETALSMRWTVLEGAGETAAFWAAARAGSAEEWLDAMETFSAPAQNGIVADRRGNIAIRSIGSFPIHPDGSGLPVRDGTTRRSDWRGLWPLERYPFASNPEQGYLASANQQPVDPRVDSTYLAADWEAPWRAIRINELLAADSLVTPDDMGRFQMDPGNARADYFMPYFLAAARHQTAALNDGAREAARLLGEWDRRYTRENERAILFERAMEELVDRTWDELLEDAPNGESGRRIYTPSSAVLASLLAQPRSAWWDDTRTNDAVETRDDILVASLDAALERVRRRYGEPDAGGWRWDRVRHINIHHLLEIPALSILGLPVQGGPGTLNPAFSRGVHGASWRMVVELGEEVRGWSIYPGGQSGNPASPRYADRIDRWVAGELDPVLFPRSAADLAASRTGEVLLMEPENAGR